MAMKYYDASLNTQPVPKQQWIDDFQNLLNDQFYDASDWFTVEEQMALGSSVYQNVDVRVNYVIDAKTGDRVGDDYKILRFKDLGHPSSLGQFYHFDNNYWLVVNIERIKSLTSSVTVRRCNNYLRWMDEQGAIYSVPCVIGYLIKESRDYSTAGSSLVNPSGIISVYTQFNSDSNKIKANQRFLFGNKDNWTCYKVFGGGINNFKNLETADNMSVGLLELTVNVNFVNEDEDDLTNGIADAKKYNYTISLDVTTATGQPEDTLKLNPTVKENGIIVNRPVVWSSNYPLIASVDQTGLVTFIDVGSVKITCSLENNSNVKDSCDITISNIPIEQYQIIFSPNTNSVLLNETVTFTVGLYKNNVLQSDVFTFTILPSNVPAINYVFTVIDDYSFSIKNIKMFLNEPLVIQCTAGLYTKNISVFLRGAW